MRRDPAGSTAPFAGEFVEYPPPHTVRHRARPHTSWAAPEDLSQQIESVVACQGSLTWRLRVLAVHDVGPTRWLQISVSDGSTNHDLVACLAPGSTSRNVIAAIESWLAYPGWTSRVIDVCPSVTPRPQ